MKDKIEQNGLNSSLSKREPFAFQYGYHYFEAKIYDLNCYYEGYNLRQLKRISQTMVKYSSVTTVTIAVWQTNL